MVGSSSRTTIQNKHKNGSPSTKWIFYHGCPCPLTWTLQKMSELNWREEVLKWIWRIWSDSGWRKRSPISYQCFLNSSGITGENSGRISWEKDVAIIVANSIYFTMRFSPQFQLFYFNDRLEFSAFFELKIKSVNNADLSSLWSYLPRVAILVEGTVATQNYYS